MGGEAKRGQERLLVLAPRLSFEMHDSGPGRNQSQEGEFLKCERKFSLSLRCSRP